MNQTVFEAHGEELIARAGMTKAEFARRMGIQRQNVKALFRSPKLDTVYKVAQVLDLPVVYLIGYVNPIDYDEEPFCSMLREEENMLLCKRVRYSAVKVKSCTMPMKRGVHASRPLKDVIGWESM